MLGNMKPTFPLTLATLLLGVSSTFASILVYDPYPLGSSPTGYTAETSLSFPVNSSVQATAGAWSGSIVGSSTYLVSATGLQYKNLAVQGGSITSFSNGVNTRAFSSADHTGAVYYSFLLNVSSFNGAVLLGLSNSAGTLISGIRLDAVDATNGTLKIRSNGVDSAASLALNANTTYLVVGKWTPGETSDTTAFWINPTVGSEEPLTPSLSYTAGKGTGVAQWYSFLGNPTTTLSFDEFRVGTTWEEVTPYAVPEPGASVLGALLLMGWGARRLWKRNPGC